MTGIELLFLGTGTSAGVPMIGCHCPVCSSSDPRDKRHRPSVLVRYDGRTILIDTTPELRVQCLAYQIDRIDDVVYTHAHADHMMGLDDVRRFNMLIDGPIDVWASEGTEQSLDRVFGYAFLPPHAKPAVFRPHLIHRRIEGTFQIGSRTWMPIPLLHAENHVLGFRIGKLAYCTDVSTIPESSFELLKGTDTLVLDALQPKPHPAHFSLPQAIEAAKRIGARQTYFTHITHNMFHAETNATLPVGMQLAHDGQIVRVED
ncbi:MAG: MBL fold metallo-hydrolase [Phycisphaerae bacterium]|nr:MBL fold metallo-hydrolase [Phycisphaerae bacterium]